MAWQIIFDNILNKEIPWPSIPGEMSFEAQDLIDRFVNDMILLYWTFKYEQFIMMLASNFEFKNIWPHFSAC